jgi:hypothetical protein
VEGHLYRGGPCSSVGPAEAEEPVVWPKPDAWWTGSGRTWQSAAPALYLRKRADKVPRLQQPCQGGAPARGRSGQRPAAKEADCSEQLQQLLLRKKAKAYQTGRTFPGPCR